MHREWLEGSEPNSAADLSQPMKSSSNNIDIMTNSNNGIIPLEPNKQTRRGINPLDSSNLNFVPTVNAPFSIPTPIGGIAPTPILHSAASSVNQFSPKSPLFDKYYRPSPDEVQKSYEYHRIRSAQDPNSFRPTDMTPIPDFPRDKQPELRSVHSEVQIPYSARVHEDLPPAYLGRVGGPSPNEGPLLAPPLTPLAPAVTLQQPPTHDPYARSVPYAPSQPIYPQHLEPQQQPIYVHSYDGQALVPAGTYGGPAYQQNTATFNQPHPTNIPIYGLPPPQNGPVYAQPAPENLIVYGQPTAPGYTQQLHPGYGQAPQPGYGQNIYYASASNAQPALAARY